MYFLIRLISTLTALIVLGAAAVAGPKNPTCDLGGGFLIHYGAYACSCPQADVSSLKIISETVLCDPNGVTAVVPNQRCIDKTFSSFSRFQTFYKRLARNSRCISSSADNYTQSASCIYGRQTYGPGVKSFECPRIDQKTVKRREIECKKDGQWERRSENKQPYKTFKQAHDAFFLHAGKECF